MYNLHLPTNYPCELLNYTSISDLSSLKNCVKSIKRMEKNSSSVSEIYRITMYNNKNIYMKLYISETSDVKSLDITLKNEDGELIKFNYHNKSLMNYKSDLMYEQYLYFNFINKISEYEICPFFVKMVGSNNNVSNNNICSFLKDKLKDKNNNSIPEETIKKAFLRNISTMLYTVSKMGQFIRSGHNLTLSHTEYPKIYPSEFKMLSDEDFSRIRYDYIITDSVEDNVSCDNFIKDIIKLCRDKSKKYSGNMKSKFQIYINNQLFPMILYIFFQVVLSCKILDMCKINHNDLHYGNILVSKIKHSCNYICNFKKDIIHKYKLNYPLTIKVYDFDLGYYYGNKENTKLDNNESLNARDMKHISQIKMLLNKFIYNISQIPKDNTFDEDEKKLFNEFLYTEFANIIMKKTKFKLYFINNSYQDVNDQEVKIKLDEYGNKYIDFHFNEKKNAFKFLLYIYTLHFNLQDFTDKSFDDNLYSLDDILENLYDNKIFKDFNKKRYNKHNIYHISHKMFDIHGYLSVNKINEFKCKNK